MIHAAIRGKLDCLRSEDALTALVFGRLRYLEPTVLAEWFAGARNYRDPARKLTSTHHETYVDFWPTLKDTLRGRGTVQPDLIVSLGDDLLIVEAKLWSSKSGVDDGSDQLARQWHGVTFHYAGRSKVAALLYITPHADPPITELGESASAMGDHAAHLWWLSWSSLAPILERQLDVGDRVSKLVADDLLIYLQEADLLRFRGWRLSPTWRFNDCWRYRCEYWRDYSLAAPSWRYR